MHKPGVVYAIPCECGSLYIGETKRTAAIRTNEEKSACAKVDRTNQLSSNTTNDLGITHHHKEFNHEFQFQNTKILANETNWSKRKILEGLFIEANKESIVNLKSGTKIDQSWTPIISSIQHLKITKNNNQA